jgi:2-oxoglutarate ferredoxin oxidoreductase subunit gamma
MKKKWEIIFSGVGGQGLLLNGNLLGAATAIHEKRQAVMTCAYGSESRGTFTKSDLIISEDYIDFPEVLEADVVVALAQVAYDRYVKTMKEGSILLYNSNQINESTSAAKQVGLPMDDLSVQAGNKAAVNMVSLGALIALTDCCKTESIKKSISERFEGRQGIIDSNLQAYDLGYKAAKA